MAPTGMSATHEGSYVERFEDRFAEREREAAPRREALKEAVAEAASRKLSVAGTLADETLAAASDTYTPDASRRLPLPTPPTPGAETALAPDKPGGETPRRLDERAGEAVHLRPVAPLTFDDLDVMPPPTDPPMVEWMAPSDLLVDGAYQRDLSDASCKLIRRVVEGWDWRRFKPPIVAWTERGFEVIDGQHTATAAATLGIEKIPVLVVEAAEQTDRASAFIGHNKDRLAVTPGQLHHAAVAAGDPDAVQVQRVCDAAEVALLRTVYGSRTYKAGDSMAVAAIGGLVKRRGERGAREVLQVLVKSGLAPITANAIKAVELLMFDEDYAGQFEPDDLAKAIEKAGDQAERDARIVTVAQAVPLWKGLAATWFRKTRKRREA